MDLAIIKVDKNTGFVSFELQSKKIIGFDKLIQVVVLELLSSEESDLLDPSEGAGLPDMIGLNYDPDDLSDVTGEITRKIDKAQRTIVANQIGLDISSEERLRRIEVRSIYPEASLGDLAVKIRVQNEAGKTRDVVL